MGMTDRKQVSEYSTIISGMYDTKDIGDLIHKLKTLRSEGYSEVELEKEWYPYESQPTIILRAVKHRKENDEEFNKRIEQENQQKEARKAQYEQLRKEFGEN
jgi:folylpolyglutamate synthase/dihydropteroate synthase